jgi:hypothetical protein
MKEHPILMNTEMVRATLELIKSQTRRIVKLPPERSWRYMPDVKAYKGELWHFEKAIRLGEGDILPIAIKCPYGKVGDRLWIKETHYLYGVWRWNGKTKTGKRKWKFQRLRNECRYFDNPPADVKPNKYRAEGWYKRPSIFMSRNDNRIDREITDIRVERVQDIDELGALSEGTPIKYFKKTKGTYKESHQTTTGEFISGSAKGAFSRLWDFINASRGYSWDSNPWVWVVEFKVL